MELEKAFNSLSIEDSFVAWRLPNQQGVNAFIQNGQPKSASVDFNREAFIISPFFNTSNQILTITPDNKYVNGKWEKSLSNTQANWQIRPTQQKGDKHHYINLVQSGVDAIKAGGLKKVVLCRNEEQALPDGFSPVEFFNQLCDEYPNAFVYLLSSKTMGTWLGATPELLMQKRENKLTTVALAGTRKLNQMETWGQKEVVEHKWVEDYVEEIVGKYTSLKIKKSGNEVKAGHLAHIFKRLEAEDVQQADKALFELHPTPAVGGLPKQEALSFIKKHEGFDRELYSGFLGPVGNNNADLFVNLRCMQLQQNSTILYAGAGIVEDSVPEKEWEETVAKMDTLRRLL